MAIATYTFLPWLRRGSRISSSRRRRGRGTGDGVRDVGGAVGGARAGICRPSRCNLIGPGDITALQSQQIIRTEPRAGVTDFEPNYLAAIDFYDEDFPWRYTPVTPDAARRITWRPGSCSSRSPTQSSRARQTAGPLSVVRADADGASPGHLPCRGSGVGVGARPSEHGARRNSRGA